MLDSNASSPLLAHYEGDVLVIPCTGQGTINSYDPVPCGCVMTLELPAGNITDAVAEAITRRYPGWGTLRMKNSDQIEGMFCSVQCMLRWKANEPASWLIWNGRQFHGYTHDT